MLGIEIREALTVVDGFANDEHGGEGEVVVVDNASKVLQLTTIDFLVGPCQVVAGGNGRVLRIFHQKFPLHIIHDSGREEDAHRALALGQKMQLFFLGHRGTTLATRQDDGLCALRDGKLAP